VTEIFGERYSAWLAQVHTGALRRADIVIHFFRTSYALIREGGVFGLIATKTIGQGDTRESGLTFLASRGASIIRAVRRLKWPGEASVTVSIVYVQKGQVATPILDDKVVDRISAYLLEGRLDKSPAALDANRRKAFKGSVITGIGFTFDDNLVEKGAGTLEEMRELCLRNPRNGEIIRPYFGGDEINNHSEHRPRRYIIDYGNIPLRRDKSVKPWSTSNEVERRAALRNGMVPVDYLDPVAADWPEILARVTERVKPVRDKMLLKGGWSAEQGRVWWLHAQRPNALYNSIVLNKRVLVRSLTSSHFPVFAFIPVDCVYDQTLVVFSLEKFSDFCMLASRAHEAWVSLVGATLEDRGRYTPSDCFRTFPFPERSEALDRLESCGSTYYRFRIDLMGTRDEGLTKLYNRFHAQGENAPDIARLRALHAEMDAAMLRAYGWDDLADRAAPEFIEQDADEGKTPKTRLDWPSDFKDEVLARLLALNATRAAEERAAGLVAADEGEEEFEGEEG
jgi:hypothetical protein